MIPGLRGSDLVLPRLVQQTVTWHPTDRTFITQSTADFSTDCTLDQLAVVTPNVYDYIRQVEGTLQVDFNGSIADGGMGTISFNWDVIFATEGFDLQNWYFVAPNNAAIGSWNAVIDGTPMTGFTTRGGALFDPAGGEILAQIAQGDYILLSFSGIISND